MIMTCANERERALVFAVGRGPGLASYLFRMRRRRCRPGCAVTWSCSICRESRMIPTCGLNCLSPLARRPVKLFEVVEGILQRLMAAGAINAIGHREVVTWPQSTVALLWLCTP